MALRDRLVRILVRFAPVAGGVVLLGAVLALLWPVLKPLLQDGGNVAWIMGVAVVIYALGHLTIRVHARRRGSFVRDERGELSFRMEPDAASQPVAPAEGAIVGLYGGRSHSGERPRFD